MFALQVVLYSRLILRRINMPAVYIGEDPKIVEDWNGDSTVRVAALSKGSNPKSPARQDNLPPPPAREQFQSEEEYEEAKGYYGSHIGRIRKMAERARALKASRNK
jgi:hypothetical protein